MFTYRLKYLLMGSIMYFMEDLNQSETAKSTTMCTIKWSPDK